MTDKTVLAALLLSGTLATAAFGQVVKPVLPSDAAARPRTPEAQAILDASTDELMREMKILGIHQLRQPKEAVYPGKLDFANYDEAKSDPYPNLPPLMTLKDGSKVTDKASWEKRRAEIKALFDSQVYGKYPKNLPKVTWTVTGTEQKDVDGVAAIIKHATGHVDNASYPAITVDIPVTVVTPAATRGRKVPVIIGGGNLTSRFSLNGPDPILHIPGSSMCLLLGPQTPPSTRQLLQKGWGFVSVDVNAVQADNGAGLTKGIIGLVNKGQPRKIDDWGVLRAWAWANSRALDYLQTDPDVNGRDVGIMGHSRGGKAALVALVDDPRFAVGFISSSGAAGANLFRRNHGEVSENVAAPNEFHWMAGNFLKYAAVGHTIDELPVDSHEFIALVAPRPVFFGGGGYVSTPACAIPGDDWQDVRGVFKAAAAASPAWEIYGRKGLQTTSFPRMETFLGSGDIGFRQHPYGHTPTPNWSYFITFASKYLK